ncbi:hypothetical protein [Halodesulfovibrio sp. MK-HDV]|jgi:hypothetical protein|uniref:hypothetical protein n=1 Tax=Halodesulfovibrio sp. MK-HDV TaxID=2599925 RepID=UPI001368D2D9|nr:hypothetical protein [Halodesulfovibrio sp. MK-HDV]KAF1077163.1 hypothetical protein MKHDV_00762 [Halodesulfovibrio sp. MK-HDV]
MKKTLYKSIFLLIALLLLVGCNQTIEESTSDNTSKKEDATSDSTPVKDAVISGAVVAAPIDNARVDAYVDGAWIPVGITKKGHIHFSDMEKITTYPVILRANKNGTGQNSKTYDDFKAELRGIMMSKDDIAYLTPVTTLAAKIFELNGSSVDAANKAKRKVTSLVQHTLGFQDIDPFADPLGDGLLKHEVLQQTFMVVLNLGNETDHSAMLSFSKGIDKCAISMQNNTFLGAAKQSNAMLTKSIAEYLTTQLANIQSRVCILLYDQEKNPDEREKERVQFSKTIHEIMTSELRNDEVSECFILTKILEGSDAFEQLTPEVATPQQTNVIPLTFKVSLLSNADNVSGITEELTKLPVPTFAGGFKISAVPEKGTLNEGQLVSSNEDQKITAGDKTYANGTEFSFFFDCKTSPIDSKHYITFTAVDNPAVTYTITFKVKAQDTVAIKSVTSTGAPKLFIFDEGSHITIHKDSVATIADQQLVASVTPAYGTVTSEDMSDAVMIQFKAPEGFAFRGDNITRTTMILSVMPTAVDDSFTFAIPNTVDIIAIEDSPIGEKVIPIEVLDQKTGNRLAQTSTAVYFVPASSVGRVASISITKEPLADITYNRDVADTDIVLEPFILSCELKTWYDVAEVPKDQQPASPMTQIPSLWKLRFDHDPTEDKGFKDANGIYNNEVDIERYASSLAVNPIKFEFHDFTSFGGSDCRLTVKPFSASDTISLYFTYTDDPENEQVATGSIILREQL